MQPDTVQTLLELNQRFYRDFGHAFAATRHRIQPGVRQAASSLPRRGRWLDLGCGSGELARQLGRSGFTGSYLGLDGSAELLEEARLDQPGSAVFSVAYRQADLAGTEWAQDLPVSAWDVLSCFAVLHHIPGSELRRRLLQQTRGLLAEGGSMAISVWQAQHSLRLMARRQPWQLAGLDENQVDAGDALLDWRYALPGQPEQVGLRYVHLFTQDELAGLAAECGFSVASEYFSDGEGGKLGLYQIWRAN
jgi:tRNA (uracil-5-)-methyltransferase TRM9